MAIDTPAVPERSNIDVDEHLRRQAAENRTPTGASPRHPLSLARLRRILSVAAKWYGRRAHQSAASEGRHAYILAHRADWLIDPNASGIDSEAASSPAHPPDHGRVRECGTSVSALHTRRFCGSLKPPRSEAGWIRALPYFAAPKDCIRIVDAELIVFAIIACVIGALLTFMLAPLLPSPPCGSYNLR